jgi:hypothetical protein
LAFRSKPLVALSIVLVLASALGSWHAPDDTDDYAAAAVHQHADHDARFTDATRPAAPEHCAFCHWLRAFGSGAPAATQLFAGQSIAVVAVAGVAGHLSTSAPLTLSSRAPPLA